MDFEIEWIVIRRQCDDHWQTHLCIISKIDRECVKIKMTMELAIELDTKLKLCRATLIFHACAWSIRNSACNRPARFLLSAFDLIE